MNKRNGTAYCRWDRLHPNNEECTARFDSALTAPVWLCRKHADRIARSTEYLSIESARQRGLDMAEQQLRIKDSEIKRLTAIVEFYPEPTPTQRAAVQRGEVRREDMGIVYFLRSNAFVKIGWTSNIDKRMKQYDPDARILAVKPGTRADEAKLHKKFAHLKTHRREWFALAPQVMEEIERTKRDHGDPPRELNEQMTTAITGPRLSRPTQMRSRSKR